MNFEHWEIMTKIRQLTFLIHNSEQHKLAKSQPYAALKVNNSHSSKHAYNAIYKAADNRLATVVIH